MNLAPSDSSARRKDNGSNFIVVKGNIAEFKGADVLVNPVSILDSDLRSSGEISNAFYEIGKEELQEKYEKAGPPECPGYDVTVTEPAGAICCKKIFHAAITSYHDETSVMSLKLVIEVCLAKAKSLSMSSIAFPAVGCGERGYHPLDVAHCFIEAAKDTETKLKVYIVAFTDELCQTFREIFTIAEESGQYFLSIPDNAPPELSSNIFVSSTSEVSLTIVSDNEDSLSRPDNPPPELSSNIFVSSTSEVSLTIVSDNEDSLSRPDNPPPELSSNIFVSSTSEVSLTTVSDNKDFLSRPDNPPLELSMNLDSLRSSQVSFKIACQDIQADNRPRSQQFRDFSANSVSNANIEVTIFHSTIAELTPRFIKKIETLQRANNAQIHIDTDQSTVTITVPRQIAHIIKQEVLKLMAEDELVRKNLHYIKNTKGVEEYLIALSQRGFIGFPDYWHNYTFPDLTMAESKRCRLFRGLPAYEAVAAFILKTWNSSLVGAGIDAKGLDFSNIAVKNIWTIENPFLFIKYQNQLKAFALRAAEKPFSLVTSLFGEPEIMTKQIAVRSSVFFFSSGVDYLNDNLIKEVNEVYLLHGTSHVDEIVKNGIDCRFGGAHGCLFGKGAYFAESSTKSDQYSGLDQSNSADKDRSLFMFVARVLLGEPFVSREGRWGLRKAPCSKLDCKKDDCRENHQMCDSVIGTHKNSSTRLLFREFIVYHPEQCYPEFLVEYVRQ